MISCTSCGADVTGKKFCSSCGHTVQTASPRQRQSTTCPQCENEINPGAAFCMHCGAALQARTAPASIPATRACPACQTQVANASDFCTNCGHDMHAPARAASGHYCNSCGQQNAPGMKFCGGCGVSLTGGPAPAYQQPPAGQPYQQQNPQVYGGQPQYPQQPMYPNQGNYQMQPMMGQGPMALRCPTCMAMAPVGTPNCRSCQTSLLNIVPTPANMVMPGQQGQQGGGFLQGNAGKYAMGALGGAAAVLGGEFLLNGLENSIEGRVEDDMGYGERHHHRHHHREDDGMLGGLGRLVDDIGL
ncbi:MAG TPA: zinc ribbon domain-containing protein [Ktedonobacteraceae bacterium]